MGILSEIKLNEDEEICPICYGSGYHGTRTDELGQVEDDPCDSCDGTKKIKKRK